MYVNKLKNPESTVAPRPIGGVNPLVGTRRSSTDRAVTSVTTTAATSVLHPHNYKRKIQVPTPHKCSKTNFFEPLDNVRESSSSRSGCDSRTNLFGPRPILCTQSNDYSCPPKFIYDRKKLRLYSYNAYNFPIYVGNYF